MRGHVQRFERIAATIDKFAIGDKALGELADRGKVGLDLLLLDNSVLLRRCLRGRLRNGIRVIGRSIGAQPLKGKRTDGAHCHNGSGNAHADSGTARFRRFGVRRSRGSTIGIRVIDRRRRLGHGDGLLSRRDGKGIVRKHRRSLRARLERSAHVNWLVRRAIRAVVSRLVRRLVCAIDHRLTYSLIRYVIYRLINGFDHRRCIRIYYSLATLNRHRHIGIDCNRHIGVNRHRCIRIHRRLNRRNRHRLPQVGICHRLNRLNGHRLLQVDIVHARTTVDAKLCTLLKLFSTLFAFHD